MGFVEILSVIEFLIIIGLAVFVIFYMQKERRTKNRFNSILSTQIQKTKEDLFELYEEKTNKLKAEHEIECAELEKKAKADAVDYINASIEQIRTEDEFLLGKSDKELLVYIIRSLGGYGTRIDRVERQLKTVMEHEELFESINRNVEQWAVNNQQLNNLIGITASRVDEFTIKVQNTINESEKIRQEVEHLNQLEPQIRNATGLVKETTSTLVDQMRSTREEINRQIKETSENVNALLTDTENKIDNSNTKLVTIITILKNSISEFNGNPVHKITDIDDTVDKIWSLLNGYEGLEKIYDILTNLKDKIEETLSYEYERTLDEIKNQQEKIYGYGDHNLDDIYRKIDYLELKPHDNFSSDIDDIKRMVSDIHYKLNA